LNGYVSRETFLSPWIFIINPLFYVISLSLSLSMLFSPHKRTYTFSHLTKRSFGGSAFPFEGGKYTVEEGGVRVFCIMHWPALLGDHRHKHYSHHSQDYSTNGTSSSSSSSSSYSFAATSFDVIWGDNRGVALNEVVSALDLFPTLTFLAEVPVHIYDPFIVFLTHIHV
jgi:hypothetical protein